MTRRTAFLFVSTFVVVGVASACSDPPSKPTATTGLANGASGSDANQAAAGGGVDGGSGNQGFDAGDSGVCNDLLAAGSVVDRVAVAAEPPVGKGGTLVVGEYTLTDYTVFTGAGSAGGPTGITAKGTLRIATDSKLDERYEFGGVGLPTSRSVSSTFVVAAATLATAQTCPASGLGRTLQYTFVEPVLVLTDPATKEAFTFTKH